MAFSQYIRVWNIRVKIVVFVLMDNMVTVKSEEQITTYWRWSCNKSNKSTQWRQLSMRAPRRHPSSYRIECTLFPCCQSSPCSHPFCLYKTWSTSRYWRQFYCFLMKLHTNSCLHTFTKESHQYKRSFSFPH